MNPPNTFLAPTWKGYEKVLFRFFFIYLFIQALPLDPHYFEHLFSIELFRPSFADIFNLTRFAPNFFGGPATFSNWLVVAVIAFAGTVAWTLLDNESKSYDRLYYWLRVVLRYRLAIAVIAYAFIKIFPLQAPFPSISNLNTHYGFF